MAGDADGDMVPPMNTQLVKCVAPFVLLMSSATVHPIQAEGNAHSSTGDRQHGSTVSVESAVAMVQPFAQLSATVERRLSTSPVSFYVAPEATPFAAETTAGFKIELLGGALEMRAYGGAGTGWPLVDPDQDDRWDPGAGESRELFGRQPIGMGEVLNYFAEEYADQYEATGDPDRDEEEYTNVEYASGAVLRAGADAELTLPIFTGRMRSGWAYAGLVNTTLAGTYWHATGEIDEDFWSYRFDVLADGLRTSVEAMAGMVFVRGAHQLVAASGYDREDHFGIKDAVEDAGYDYEVPVGGVPILFEWTMSPPGRRYETTLAAQTNLMWDTPIPVLSFAVEWMVGE